MATMPTLHVRNVPDDVYVALRTRAEREGRSMSAEVIAILRRTLLRRRDPDDLLADIRATRSQAPLPSGAPKPEDLIREDRDARSRRL
jgi:plasmid stability protein